MKEETGVMVSKGTWDWVKHRGTFTEVELNTMIYTGQTKLE